MATAGDMDHGPGRSRLAAAAPVNQPNMATHPAATTRPLKPEAADVRAATLRRLVPLMVMDRSLCAGAFQGIAKLIRANGPRHDGR